jgi:hypothetical protein
MTPIELKSWQLRLGLDRSSAAAVLGVKPRTYYSWLNYERRIPRTAALLARRVEADLEAGKPLMEVSR